MSKPTRVLTIVLADKVTGQQVHAAFDEDNGVTDEEILLAVESLREQAPRPDNIIDFLRFEGSEES